MKKILFLVAILNLLFATNESDTKLDELMHYQNNQPNIIIDYNPFMTPAATETGTVNAVQSSTESRRALRLVAIINQKAFINGQWYSIGQSVEGHKIVKIYKQSVELKKGNKTTHLAYEEARELLHVKDSKK